MKTAFAEKNLNGASRTTAKRVFKEILDDRLMAPRNEGPQQIEHFLEDLAKENPNTTCAMVLKHANDSVVKLVKLGQQEAKLSNHLEPIKHWRQQQQQTGSVPSRKLYLELERRIGEVQQRFHNERHALLVACAQERVWMLSNLPPETSETREKLIQWMRKYKQNWRRWRLSTKQLFTP
jgi:hypothetical protein